MSISLTERFDRNGDRNYSQAFEVVTILLFVVEVEGGIANGLRIGAGTRQAYQFDNLVAAHAADAPDSLIKSALFPNEYYPYANIRALSRKLPKGTTSVSSLRARPHVSNE